MGAPIKIGTSAWADRVLIETGWYPKHVRSAEAKLRYYATQFPIVENDATYWAFPDRERVATWAARTPPGFTMNMKAHALLTEHYASVRGLPRDIRESLAPELLEKPHVYPRDVGEDVIEELTRRFRDALAPLYEAGRLGVVLLQFPVWFPYSVANQRKLEQLREAFAPYPVAVELRNRTWMAKDTVEKTLHFLAHAGLIYTCVDEPQGFVSSIPPIAAATHPIAVVRMHGRNQARWERRTRSAAQRFDYRYSIEELEHWVGKLLALAEHTREVHVLFSNGPLQNAVANARQLVDLVAAEERVRAEVTAGAAVRAETRDDRTPRRRARARSRRAAAAS
jgi:uncharacterized protein YecE (DUF72 family)